MPNPTPDGNSLRIFMHSSTSATYIDCNCTRWDEDGYNIICETYLGSANRNLLASNITPGLVRELKSVLGKPWVLDGSFRNRNTIFLCPISGYGLSGVRKGREVVVKNFSDQIIHPNYYSIKLELSRTKQDVW